MAEPKTSSLLVFGDQSVSCHAFLQKVWHQGQGSVHCTAFLQEVNEALREEISNLNIKHRENIPPFSTIQELDLRYARLSGSHAGIDGALLCITQLAHYISASEQWPCFGQTQTILAGFCTGALAAAAVACCPDIGSIAAIGCEAVRLAFRAGCLAQEASELLHNGSSTEIWAYAVPDMDSNECSAVLQNFNSLNNIPAMKAAYISAVASHTVTISGAPSTLNLLFSDLTVLGSRKRFPLPIHAPYHASHIHSASSIIAILPSDLPDSVLYRYRAQNVVLSARSGEVITTKSARELFSIILHEMLREPLNLEPVIDGCAALVAFPTKQSVKVSGLGPTNIIDAVITSLRKKTNNDIDLGVYSRWIASEKIQKIPSSKTLKPKLAIVGMAGRFPSSGDHDKFWDLLMAGVDAHRPIPSNRFDSKLYHDPTNKVRNTSHTTFGNFINDPGMFDPRFFNLSPREAAQTDPMQRLALVTAYEALEMAGYVPNRTPASQLERIGTYYGQTSDDWREINASQDIDTYYITGGVRAFGPGRINYTFKFSGPSFNIDTACSSSLAAIQIACTALQAGECDTAVAGGVSILTNPDIFSGLSRGQFLSKTGNCQTFDNNADGYCRADGIGTVVIKRLEDAKADNDNVLAVILGSATNHSAQAISITHPHDEAQEFLYSKILSEAGVDANDVDYVEMHGTGTQAGDDTEMRSVTNVFAPTSRKRRPDQPLYIGSVKANVGHGEAASGVIALIKCLMMLKRNKIPPHVGIKTKINANFPKNLAERNVNIALGGSRDFSPRSDRLRMVYVNNFSAAGGNTGLLMQERCEPKVPEADPRPTHVITVSAKSKLSMKRNLERLLDWLENNSDARLEDLSYTLTARRQHHNYRYALQGSSTSQVKLELKKALDKKFTPIASTRPKVCFLFTGQGTIYAGLGRDAYAHEPRFRADILTFDEMAVSLGFPSFISVVNGSMADITKASAMVAQLAIVCVELALARLWRVWGIEPDVVIGHSLGEYAALCIAGALSAIDTIYLVGTRASLLEQHCAQASYAMLSVRAEEHIIETLPAQLRPLLSVSCFNAPQDTVLGGAIEDIDLASSHLNSQGVKCVKLELPFAFHTRQVDAIIEHYQAAAQCIDFSKPQTAFLSTLTGDRYNAAVSPQYLARQAREPVRFSEALLAGRRSGELDDSTIFVEIGPHPVCLGMVKSTLVSSCHCGSSLRKNENFYQTISATACMLHSLGAPLAWNEYHYGFKQDLSLLTLPAYAFDEKNYWIQYTGDWCLNKNAPHPLMKGSDGAKVIEVESLTSTTTVHKLAEEELNNDILSIITETDISRPDMMQLATGHKVNGVILLSSTVLADMAMTIGEYIKQKYRKDDKDMRCNIANMMVQRPIRIKTSTSMPQVVRVVVKTDIRTTKAAVVFSTVQDKSNIEHGTCTVQFGDPEEWKAEWKRVAYLIQGRIRELQIGLTSGNVQLIRKRMAYKLFSALVDYNDAYCGMEEVHLNSDDFEASAKVRLVPNAEDTSFHLNPCWIDSTCHITGFICNASDAVDSHNQVYISHGWDSLRFAEELSLARTYRSYVRMQPTGQGKIMAGDVYIFDTERDEIIASGSGVKFQGIARSLLNTFLPPANAAAVKPKAVTSAHRTDSQFLVAEANMVVKPETIVATIAPPVGTLGRTLEIIAEELGIGVDELDDPINFAEVGCDSLMSLSITGRMREEMDIEIESHVFVDHPTVGQLKIWIKDTFEGGSEHSSNDTPASGSSSGSDIVSSGLASPSTPTSTHDTDNERRIAKIDLATRFESLQDTATSIREIRAIPSQDCIVSIATRQTLHATSVILQGSPRRAIKTLWICPDGGGSATSYMSIPKLGDSICVYGLNSPYMKTPEEYTHGLVEITTKFVAEIRRKQPKGPYSLAGWSAGGVVAFEASQQLLAAGEDVEKLLLLDAPCPLIIEPLPSTLHAFFNEIGLLGDGLRDATKIPPWLLPHFAASVAALSTYRANELPAGKSPKTLALWCTDGVCKLPEDPRPEPYPYGHAQWLLENRTDFGPNLWDKFIDEDKMKMVTVPGNHFTMMRSPNVELMGDHIRDFMLSSC